LKLNGILAVCARIRRVSELLGTNVVPRGTGASQPWRSPIGVDGTARAINASLIRLIS
jgi:hypothetical protein